MALNVRTEIAQIGFRLLDEAYMAWSTAAIMSEHALHAWFDAAPRQRPSAYVAYCAALDREAAAGADLQRLWQLAEQ
jgi:hypothetical protein